MTEREMREQLEQQVRELREQLGEAQETLRAIRESEVDALVVKEPEGDRVFTLQRAERPYLPPVAGALLQGVIDVLAVLNALRASVPPQSISDMQPQQAQ